MVTNLLIEIGGISRAFVKFGMIVAHLTAFYLYKAALIKDLFLVEAESKEPHPAHLSFLQSKKEEKEKTDEAVSELLYAKTKTKYEEQDSEISEKQEAGEMHQMYKGAKRALRKGKLVR